MKKAWFSIISLGLIVTGCNNDDLDMPVISACDVKNPIENLEWLGAEVEKRKNNTSEDALYCYIEQATAGNETIFIYNDCNPLINKVLPIYDCSGNSVGLLGDENFATNTITKRTIIFKPSNFKCQID
ncbi:MAG: hypothetical protein WBB27_00265 [Maribacter sp.]